MAKCLDGSCTPTGGKVTGCVLCGEGMPSPTTLTLMSQQQSVGSSPPIVVDPTKPERTR